MALKLPRGMYALVDDGVRPEVSAPQKARWAIEGGAAVVQLRLERTADRQALAWIREVMDLAGEVPVIVNDRVDLCLAAGASGVHLGDDDLPVPVARRLLGPGALIGRTTRSVADVVRAKEEGADHVGLGPIFSTSTKAVNAAVLGLERFAALVRDSPLPVVGIAGITLDTIGGVSKAGARCAAVASDWLVAENPEARVRALVRAFGR
ncbi:MAG: thiamine phosphate synthase [Myxococcaceae bacterium]|nr:thiamine phosphate synthase [Myxococcaceae bacterium]